MNPLAAILLVVLGASLVLTGCAAPGENRSTAATRSGGLATVLEDVRRNPEDRAAAEAYCRLSVSGGDSDFPYQAFFAGFLSVPPGQSGDALCTAMIEAVISGDLTENDLAQFSNRARNKMPLGTLLRKVLAAHLRLQGQTALETEIAPGSQAG